jgi:hypothetical protein
VTTGITSAAHPTDVIAGPNSTVWFTEPGIGALGQVTSGGVNTVTELPLGWSPTALANQSTRLFISQGPADKVSVRAFDGAVSDVPVAPTAGATPTNVAPTVTDGVFFFTEPGLNRVGYVGPAPPSPPPGTPEPDPVVTPGKPVNLTAELTSGAAKNVTVKVPKASKKARARRCYVPRLKGRTLKGVKKILKKNRCALGKITLKAKTGKLRVTKQSKKVHLRTKYKTKVNITLGRRASAKHK